MLYRLAFAGERSSAAWHERFDSSISLVAILFQFAEAKMNAKAVVAASTTIVGAAAIVGAERRPHGYYHNFIISSFQGSLPPVSRQQHLNARRTRYRPRFCVFSRPSCSPIGRPAVSPRAPTDSLVSCWEHVQVAPTTSELFKQLERLTYTREVYLFNKIRPFIF